MKEKVKKILTKSITLPLWALIVGVMVIVAIAPQEKVEVEKIVEKPVEVEKIKEVKMDCSAQETKLEKCKEVVRLDNKVFLMTGDFIGNLEYWLYHPLEAENEMTTLTRKINIIAAKKQILMGEIGD